jgi:hypothetical protein
MKQVDMYRWRVPQKPPKKPYLTRYYMTLEEGRASYPEGEPALEWKEVRMVCETPEETALEMAKGQNPSFPPKGM